jgi:uncharacterized protein (DUF2132 family)
MLEALVARHGWPELARRIHIRCFTHDPSLSSSLAFLRRNEWARADVEKLYLADLRRAERNRQRNAERAAQRAHRAQQDETAAESGSAAVCAPEAPSEGDAGPED